MLTGVLAAIGRWSQFGLIAGLLIGIALPGLADVLRPQLTPLIVALLFFAALRIEPRAMSDLRLALTHDIPVVLALQLGLPLALILLFGAVGWSGSFATMLVLIAAAAPITGSAPIAQMAGQSGATAMRILLWGTFLVPLTSMLPLRYAFGTGTGFDVAAAALRLAAVIGASVLGAALVRTAFLRNMSGRTEMALAGVTTILLAVFVVALMDAVQPALLASPGSLAAILLFTCAANVTLQAGAALFYRQLLGDRAVAGAAGAVGVTGGNRNIALFLAALPAAQTESLMVLVGCYQIPMYLTPITMRPLYRWLRLN